MTLVDTNVIVDARTKNSPFHDWAEDVLTTGISGEGISVNAIVLAELCVGVTDPDSVEAEVRAKGLEVADVPAAASVICARAYSRYRLARKKSGGGRAPHIPLPDFFIGAHAELMGWKLATRDTERYRLYFERVELIQPVSK